MKILLTLIALLCSFSLSASSCKCNCKLIDNTICASDYDLDKPCRGICSGQMPGAGPMITACPVIEVAHPLTGVKQWISVCIQYN